jgi:DNA-binding response OmpR family regulator
VMADLGPMLDRAIDYERSGTHRRTHDDPTTPRASGEGIATRPVVVVADDDELIRRALERALSARGFDVYTADSGDMALSMCLRHQPHVLVTDHHMPGLTGVEVAQMARRSMGGAAPAVILLTGADVRPAPGAVARRLQKPVTLDALVAEIQAVLGEETLARSSAAPTGTSRPR